MLKTVLDDPHTQSDALDTLFDFNRPRGSWRIQRPDGQYFHRWVRNVREFTPDADKACPFLTEQGAQHVIDIQHGSQAGRKAFRGCKPVSVAPLFESGDHGYCVRCGALHEQDFCPASTVEGDGVAR